MSQKQNLRAIDKARIYPKEFASEQITFEKKSDELSAMDIRKDKLFHPRYTDYFDQ
jgi:hypothetical protein